jgi:hypothetical protein
MGRLLCLLAAALLAGCASTREAERVPPASPAEPQRIELDWRESYPPSGQRLRFLVDRIVVRRDGWSADIAVTNSTGIPFRVEPGPNAFGLMLSGTGDLADLTKSARAGTLPPVRQARTIEPPPPEVLRPNETWRATLSAPGSLAAGSWVRVSFGPFVAGGALPEGMQSPVVWITDRAHRI